MSVTEDFVIRGRADVGGATQGLSRMSGAVIALNQALELGEKAVRFFNAAVVDNARIALDQERVFANLRNRLDGMGIAYADVSGELAEFFAQMQATTRFGDDAMAGTIARLATATAALEPSIGQLQRWAVDVADFAEANQISLEASSRIIQRAVAGDVEALGRYMPAYRDTLREIGRIPDAAERSAQAMAILRDEFGGAASSLNQLDLQLARIENGMGDFREAIGDTVIQSDAVTNSLGTLANQVDVLAAAFTAGEDGPTAMGRAIEAMATTSVNAISSLIEFALGSFVRLRQASLAIEGTLTDRQATRFGQAAEGAGRLAAGEGGFLDRRADQLRVSQALESAGFDTEARRVRSLGRNVSDEDRAWLQQLQRELEAARDGFGNAGDEVAGEFAQLQAEHEAALAEIRARRETDTNDLGEDDEPTRRPRRPRPPQDPEPIDKEDEEAAAAEAMRALKAAAIESDGVVVPLMFEADDAVDDLALVQQGLADLFAQAAEESLEYQLILDDIATEHEREIEAIQRQNELLEVKKGLILEQYEAEKQAMQDRADMQREIDAQIEQKEEFEIPAWADPVIASGVSTITSAATNLGAALGGTGEGSKKAGKAFLAAIGQMAAGIGAMYVAMAPPMFIPNTPAFNPAGGAAYLAGGIALVALGSALGSAFGKSKKGGGRASGASTANLEETGIRDNANRDLAAIERQNVLVIDTVVSEDPATVRRLAKMTQNEIGRGGALVMA